LLLTLPVTFAEATLGADIKIPTLSGDDVTVRLAAGTPTGRVLRVKGRGITKGHVVGDLLVTIEVQVPRRVEGEALDALKKFAELTAAQDIRSEFISKAKA
jgi:molecular chaperone DnaJ